MNENDFFLEIVQLFAKKRIWSMKKSLLKDETVSVYERFGSSLQKWYYRENN